MTLLGSQGRSLTDYQKYIFFDSFKNEKRYIHNVAFYFFFNQSLKLEIFQQAIELFCQGEETLRLCIRRKRQEVFWAGDSAPAIPKVEVIDLNDEQDVGAVIAEKTKQPIDFFKPPLLKSYLIRLNRSKRHIFLIVSTSLFLDPLLSKTYFEKISVLYQQLTKKRDLFFNLKSRIMRSACSSVPATVSCDLFSGIEQDAGEIDQRMTSKIKTFCKKNKISYEDYFRTIYFFIISNYFPAETQIGLFQNDYMTKRLHKQSYQTHFFRDDSPIAEAFRKIQTANATPQDYQENFHQAQLNRPLFQFSYNLQEDTQVVFLDRAYPLHKYHLELPDHFFIFQLVQSRRSFSTSVLGARNNNSFLLQSFIGRVKHISSQLVDGVPSFSQLSFLTKNEKHHILLDFNRTQADYPKDKTIQQLFEEQVTKSPHNTAVVFEDKSLTYEELNAQANQMAHYLREEKGIKPDDLVAVCMDRSLEMIITILGILKAGGAYLPINIQYPQDRIRKIIQDSRLRLFIGKEEAVKQIHYHALRVLKRIAPGEMVITRPREPVHDFDSLPFPDRSLIDYHKYNKSIGEGYVWNNIILQATRGCPYKCLYCHKIWPKQHVFRSAQNIYEEVKYHYDKEGYRTFSFVDDIFNLNKKNSEEFFKLVIKNKLKIRILFPNGLRGDILTPDYINLMVEAGTIEMSLALETASPRLQKLIHKNLNIDPFRKNLEYIAAKHPYVMLDLFTMVGFPTETEEEVFMTLDFIKSIKWIHFPLISILRIFPNSDMARLAMEHGVSEEIIERNVTLPYHQVGDDILISKGFAQQYQARFLSEYFLNLERLKYVISHQKKVLTREEMNAKYQSYLPGGLSSHPNVQSIIDHEFKDPKPDNFLDSWFSEVPSAVLPAGPKKSKADSARKLKILLLDLSMLFRKDVRSTLYDAEEAPLGLMYLLTYLNKKLGEKILGKILTSRVDFDSFDELKKHVEDFKPDVIGIRTLTIFRDFFHITIDLLKQWTKASIITGGPYATSDYASILSDKNIDIVVRGEGELTFTELMEKTIANNNQLPSEEILNTIPGLVFIPKEKKAGGNPALFANDFLILETAVKNISKYSRDNPSDLTHPRSLVYCIYTSGSTGKPKGTLLEHNGLVNLLNWQLNEFKNGLVRRTLQYAPLSFDVSFQEIFSSLISGSELFLLPEEKRMDFQSLKNFIANHQIERIFLPYITAEELLRTMSQDSDAKTPLKEMITAGEQLQSSEAITGFFSKKEGKRLINQYGPTEAHVVTRYSLPYDASQWAPLPPIGTPIFNIQIYILDSSLEPTPIGVPGEVHIGGVGLARGYLNRADLTAEKFIPNSFTPGEGERLYKTGDLARYLPDGNIEFLGRIDFQVKIRGFRIELGEIESNLREHPDIKDSVVLAKEDPKDPHNKYLIAYLIPKDLNTKPNTAELRSYLEDRLPEYMVSTHFIYLDTLPLSPNGKVDRKALPLPDNLRPELGHEYVPPRNPEEEILCNIWREILRVDRVGIHDNFFELGGHSLLMTQVVNRIRSIFSIDLPLKLFFENPYVEAIATLIKDSIQHKQQDSTRSAEDREKYKL